jgi:hypothetical protein
MTDTLQSGADLPSSVRDGLDGFSKRLQNALGDSLVSVVLYGGLTKGEYFDPNASNVNVMVVLKEVTVEILDRVAGAVQEATRSLRLAPMVLSETDLRCSTDVFPVKFLDMQRHHRLIAGRDVLKDLVVAKDHLRLRCEQEIKNLLIRLRGFYLRRVHLPEAIADTVRRAISSLLGSLAVLVELQTGQAPIRKLDIVEQAARLGLDVQPLRRALALKRGELKLDRGELRQLYDALMRTVEQAAEIADRGQERAK